MNTCKIIKITYKKLSNFSIKKLIKLNKIKFEPGEGEKQDAWLTPSMAQNGPKNGSRNSGCSGNQPWLHALAVLRSVLHGLQQQ